MTIYRPLVGMSILLALLFGCGSNNDSNNSVEEGAPGGSIVVHASDGNPTSQPVYTWLDGLSSSANDLKVARQSNTGTAVWEIRSANPSQDDITSPWQHGQTSGGTVVEIASSETSLQTDVMYIVTVTNSSGHSGSREFRIKP